MKKAPEAFRTISEVAELLDTPAHVLRFWESKFYQIRPVKRAGGRRYYRPDDVALIGGIKVLLQDQGLTIRGAQRVLHEQGVRQVAALAPPISALGQDEAVEAAQPDITPAPVIEEAELVAPAPSQDAGKAEPDVAPAAPEPEAPVQAEATPDRTEPEAGPGLVADSEAEPVAENGAEADLDLGADIELNFWADVATDTADDSAEEPVAAGQTPPKAPSESAPEPATEPAQTTEPALAAPELRLARRLRALPRGGLGPARTEEAAILARRLDALLDRMSEASGAGRW